MGEGHYQPSIAFMGSRGLGDVFLALSFSDRGEGVHCLCVLAITWLSCLLLFVFCLSLDFDRHLCFEFFVSGLGLHKMHVQVGKALRVRTLDVMGFRPIPHDQYLEQACQEVLLLGKRN